LDASLGWVNEMSDRLRVWLMASQSSWQSTLNRILTEYCAMPGVEIELTCVSWNRAWSLIVESLKNNALPDVIQVGSTWLSGLIGLNALAGIDPVEARQRFGPIEDYSPVLWDRVVQQEQAWAVPWMQDFRLLYYRRDRVEDLPGFSQGLENWVRLLDLFTASSPYVFPGLPEPVLVQTVASWGWAMGGDFPQGRMRLSENWDGFIGIEALYRTIQSGGVARESAAMGAGEVNHWFFDRGLGAWYLSRPISLEEMDLRYWGNSDKAKALFGVAAIPLGTTLPYSSFVGGSFLAVSKSARRPDLAWDLVERLSGVEAQSEVSQSLLSWPARRSAILPEFVPRIDASLVRRAMERGQTEPMLPHWPVYEAVLARRLANLFSMAWDGVAWNQTRAERSGLVRDYNDVVWVTHL